MYTCVCGSQGVVPQYWLPFLLPSQTLHPIAGIRNMHYSTWFLFAGPALCLPTISPILVRFLSACGLGLPRITLIILVPISLWPKALFHLDIYSGVEFQFQRAHTFMPSFSRCPHCVSSLGYISKGRQFSGSWTCGEASSMEWSRAVHLTAVEKGG